MKKEIILELQKFLLLFWSLSQPKIKKLIKVKVNIKTDPLAHFSNCNLVKGYSPDKLAHSQREFEYLDIF